MVASILGVIDMLVWPLLMAAGGWVIAIKALAYKDEISRLVEALTPLEATEKTKGLNLARSRKPAFTDFQTSRRISRRTSARHRWKGHLQTAARFARRGPYQYASRARTRRLSLLAIALINACALLVANAPLAYAERFAFDQRRSEVRFAYKMAYSTQRGRFTKVSGMLDYDQATPEKSKIRASIATSSLTTGEELVDEQLKGPAFFNVAASPVIVFKSLKVRPLSDTTAEVLGEITVNSITKPVKLSVTLKPHDDPALKYDAGAQEFVATTRIKRSEFNMTDYKSLVDDDVDIEIAAIVRPKQDASRSGGSSVKE